MDGETDPCLDGGYVCTIDNPCVALGYECIVPIGPNSTFCELPGQEAPCSTSVGCAPPFSCVNGEPLFGTPGYQCLQICTTSAGCMNPFDVCEESSTGVAYCIYNFCGPGLPSTVTSSGPSYYAPCDSQGSDDGTCVPWQDDSITIGFCEQAGTAPTSGPCDPSRDGGLTSQCPLYTLCVQGTDGLGFCAPMCAPVGSVGAPTPSRDGGFTGRCDGGLICIGTDDYEGSVIGACLAACGPGTPCSGSLICQEGLCLP